MKSLDKVLVAVAVGALLLGTFGSVVEASSLVTIAILIALAIVLTLVLSVLRQSRVTALDSIRRAVALEERQSEQVAEVKDELLGAIRGLSESQELMGRSLEGIPQSLRKQLQELEKESHTRAKKMAALFDVLQRQVVRASTSTDRMLALGSQLASATERGDQNLKQLLTDQLALIESLSSFLTLRAEAERQLLSELTRDLVMESTMEATLEHLKHTLLEEIDSSQEKALKKAVVAMQAETQQVEALLQLHVGQAHSWPLPSLGLWALDARSALHLRAIVLKKKPKSIVELGSGTSTVWLGYLCREVGAKLVSIEHLESYYGKIEEQIELHGLSDVVDLRLGELIEQDVDGERFRWYSPSAFEDLHEIDVLLVDGPPSATGRLARFPALPLLAPRLNSGALVLLDDCDRPDEVAITKRWRKRFPGFTRHHENASRLAVLEDTGSRQVADV